MKLTLIIMAAGMGSRYGGLKQAERVTPNGRTILDFSVYDALRSGFDRVVFVVREDMAAEFRARVGDRIARKADVTYILQDVSCLPAGRTKPFGTAHAVLCCRPAIDGPFAVCNADDYYGPNAFSELAKHLRTARAGEYAMTAYRLGNTLSLHGTVSRGVCEIEGDTLRRITEVKKIAPDLQAEGAPFPLTRETPVSMNLWGFTPDLFDELARQYEDFLATADLLREEFYLPMAVGSMLAAGKCGVRVFMSDDKWYGVTYREDLEEVRAALGGQLQHGSYKGI